MCEECKGEPTCPCACTFVEDVDLVLTIMYRGIPITQKVCKTCGHPQSRARPHKIRVQAGGGP